MTHLDELYVGPVASQVHAVDESGNIYQAGTRIYPSTTGLTPGTGLTSATGFVYKSGIHRAGDLITTHIYMDITGLNSGGASGDIIGKNGGTANCHFGQITAAVNGTIVAGWIDVAEAPTGGDPDINLGCGDEATGAENAALSGLTHYAALCNSGDLAVGTRVNLTAFPSADQYLYLVVGTQTDADYTAGQILVTLVGVDLS
jgi:hypothetical protein